MDVNFAYKNPEGNKPEVAPMDASELARRAGEIAKRLERAVDHVGCALACAAVANEAAERKEPEDALAILSDALDRISAATVRLDDTYVPLAAAARNKAQA